MPRMKQLERALIDKLAPESIILRVPSFVTCAFVACESDAIGTMPERLAAYLVRELPLDMFNPPFATAAN